MIKTYNKIITEHLQLTNILRSYLWFNMLCKTGMGEFVYLLVFALLTLNCSEFLVSFYFLFFMLLNGTPNWEDHITFECHFWTNS